MGRVAVDWIVANAMKIGRQSEHFTKLWNLVYGKRGNK